MKVVHNRDPYYTIVYDFYSPDELSAIWTEFARLGREQVLSANPEDTAGAYEDKLLIALDPRQLNYKKYIKLNYGRFLDEIYAADRKRSALLTFNQNVVRHDPDYKAAMTGGDNPFNNYLFHITYYTTLLNYYEQNHYYAPHIDGCCLTAISYFWKEPKRFDGGDLSFPDFSDHPVPLENNSVLIFPSFQKHAVTAVNLKEGVPAGELNGRFAVSQFLSHNIEPKRVSAPRPADTAPSFLDKLGISTVPKR